MNENRIQQVLMIEKEAQEIADAAIREAEQLPLQAEQEAQAILDKARAEALDESRKLVANAEAKDECVRIQAEAEERVKNTKTRAMNHFERAVAHVIDRVAGRE